MNKVVSAPEFLLPQSLVNGVKYFSQYANPSYGGVGWFGKDLPLIVANKGFVADSLTWDFVTIALSVSAADRSIPRSKMADGWTREIELVVHVSSPLLWIGVTGKFERMLRFLTGDIWHVDFQAGGIDPSKRPRRRNVEKFLEKYNHSDCIALLSGGVDSLVGCIDLVEGGRNPVFVSSKVTANCEQQRIFASQISSNAVHMQLGSAIHLGDKESENSTRGRSIVFFAFAALAASAIRHSEDSPVPIFVSENGFISLNIALNPGRIASFSTKTTHPVYMRLLSEIWKEVGINCELILPYKYKTKGEMIAECKNASLLEILAGESTSCSRFGRYARMHCGRCLPCLVRQAAFAKAGVSDPTIYKFSVGNMRRTQGPDDVGAIAGACTLSHRPDFLSSIMGDFYFAGGEEKRSYIDVYRRGLSELESQLRATEVI